MKTVEASPTPLQPPATRTRATGTQLVSIDKVASSPLYIQQMESSWDEESVVYFLNEYSVLPLPGMYSGHLDFLPDLLMSSSSTSPLWPATRASAYLALSRHYKSSVLYDRARKCYGAALRSVNTCLSQPPETWQDDIVAAIMMTNYLEVFCFSTPRRHILPYADRSRIWKGCSAIGLRTCKELL